jgi:hypothetical protein
LVDHQQDAARAAQPGREVTREQLEAELAKVTAERDALRASNFFLARRLYETEIHIGNLLGTCEVEARDFHKRPIH